MMATSHPVLSDLNHRDLRPEQMDKVICSTLELPNLTGITMLKDHKSLYQINIS